MPGPSVSESRCRPRRRRRWRRPPEANDAEKGSRQQALNTNKHTRAILDASVGGGGGETKGDRGENRKEKKSLETQLRAAHAVT